jgi:hypothetical protein
MTELHILNGRDAGLSFHLNEGINYIGRSSENDILIEDATVSRRHLRIVKESNRYFVTDVGSRNGTFFNGNHLVPGVEIEVQTGVPIAIGMTMLAIGSEFLPEMIPHLDSMGLTRDTGNNSGIFAIHKEKTNQKKLELLYRVTDLLQKGLPKYDSLEELLEIFLEFFVKIDTVTFVLVHPETGKTVQVISKSRENVGHPTSGYSEVVVYKVLAGKKPLVIVDAKAEESDEEFTTTLKITNVTSVMCVPMIGFLKWSGVYFESIRNPYPFAPEDVLFLHDIANLSAPFILVEVLANAPTLPLFP